MLAKLLDMVVRHRDAGDRVRKSLCAGRPQPWHSWSLRLGVVHSSSLVELYIRIYGQLAYVRSCGNFSCQYIWFPCVCQGNK